MQSYDLELNKVIERINKDNAKLVCVQLPDGLKPRAKEIQQACAAMAEKQDSSENRHA